MTGKSVSARLWVTAVVVAHLIISIAHGAAHDGAHVPVSRAANVFIFIVILGGPIAGAALLWWRPRAGNVLVAGTMAASLLFGVVNHFLVSSPDHVSQIAESWQPLFASTAILLALTEALGAGLAVRAARERIVVS